MSDAGDGVRITPHRYPETVLICMCLFGLAASAKLVSSFRCARFTAVSMLRARFRSNLKADVLALLKFGGRLSKPLYGRSDTVVLPLSPNFTLTKIAHFRVQGSLIAITEPVYLKTTVHLKPWVSPQQ